MWRTKKKKVAQNSSWYFCSMTSVLVFQFQGMPLFIRLSALYGGEKKKKRKGLVGGKTKRMRSWEGPLETGSAMLMKEGSESHKGRRLSDRVRRVKNKEYCAITSSLHPLNSFLCLPNPNSGGIFTGKCLVLPLAHINTEWRWLRKLLHGNYVTEWLDVRWWFFSYSKTELQLRIEYR